MRRIFSSRWTVAAGSLFLIASGLLAVVWGVVTLLPGEPAAPVAPSPTFHERLVPTPTSHVAEGSQATASPLRRSTLPAGSSTPGPVPTHPPTPMIPAPTPTPMPGSTRTASATVTPTHGLPLPPSLTSTARVATLSPTQAVAGDMFSTRQRIGVVGPRSGLDRYDMARLGAGWYVQTRIASEPLRPAGMEAVQFVGIQGNTYSPAPAVLRDIVRRNPGTLWLVGNEPDVIWQSNSTPQEYAKAYHDVYFLLKSADPACHVAIGGISQVTPLRLRYLEAVLASHQETYGQPMPVDVWNIHLAILREERGSWGVDIPPGLPDDTGILYQIEDNARVEILKDQVWTFRRWMAGRGLRDEPLIVTEFSVLMPPDYGFPFETVRDYMIAAFDFLLTVTDETVGCPADGNRLVQRFAWYSIADPVYHTGNLFDPQEGEITLLGQAFAGYVASLVP
jgi:hypothetical protein